MKLKLALVFDTAHRAHLINPAQICSIAATGGTSCHGGKQLPQIGIRMSNGDEIVVSNIGETEEDAVENLIAQLEEDANGIIPSERIQG